MAVMRVQVFYEYGARAKWTNVYHCTGTAVGAVKEDFLAEGVPLLIALLDPACSIRKILVSDLAGPDFVEAAVNTDGDHFGSGTILPLFNRAKVEFDTGGSGRPDIKYLGGFVGEDNSDANGLSDAAIVEIVSAYTDMIDAIATAGSPLASENGDLWVSVSVQRAIQMRQLHRKRRRTAPAP